MNDSEPRVGFEFFVYFAFVAPAVGSILSAIFIVFFAPDCIHPCTADFYSKYTFALLFLVVWPGLGMIPAAFGVIIAHFVVEFFGHLSDRKSLAAGFLGAFLASPVLYYLTIKMINPMIESFGDLVVVMFVPVVGLASWALLWYVRPRRLLGPLTPEDLNGWRA